MKIVETTKAYRARSAATRALALMSASATALALLSAPAYAQNTNQPADEAEEDDAPVIVVTGSILRQTDKETASPVTELTAANLEARGINNTAEALQRLSATGAGTIANGWNAGFNFASGANAPALRGLTVQNTLSIVDGLRMAPYPLADDGQRNFVDLNTIPSAITERIQVLRDGASSTYGADAIAGVVNVITKKEVQGLHLNGSFGLSDQGDAMEQRIDATFGYGDLDDQGFNFYVSGEYQNQDALWARDRDYPFNSADQSGVCSDDGSTCGHNGNWNGWTEESQSFNGLISIPGISLVRPVQPGATSGSGQFQYLNPGAGCGPWETNTNIGTSATSPSTICEVDFVNKYFMLQPAIERMGVTARFTANLGDSAQFYVMGTWYNTKTEQSLTPIGLNGTPAPSPSGLTVPTYNVLLPVYVCSAGVGTVSGENTGCNAQNGTLNPNNPFAAQGLRAQLFLRNPEGRTADTDTRALRGVVGIDGTFGAESNWQYSVNLTASEVRLKRTQENYFIPQHIMNVVADGSFNFIDPSANTQEQWDYISPPNHTTALSKLWQVQATLGGEIFQLPGGAFQAAVGVSYREESIDAPSGNPANDAAPYDRYLSVNAVGTKGSRDVKSAFFELSAPIIDQIELTGSGRYDKYSTGQENFSPKVGLKFKPVEELLIRGTFSKGFRIPSFNEAFGLPTTGYVTRTVNCTAFAAFCASHGNNAYATQSYSLGLTQTGNPSLAPEKSTSFTAGVVFEPVRNVAFSVDFWHIKIKDLIVGVTNTSDAENAYYANNGVVNIPGIVVVPGTPDPAFPNALPTLGFIQSSYKNATSQTVSGIDFGINANFEVATGVRVNSQLDASYLIKYELTDEVGDKYEYQGTLSPCNITSCSGAPSWRATWQNTVTFNNTSVTLTAYYTKGVDTAQVDYGGIKGDCQANLDNGVIFPYEDGVTPIQCKTKDIWNADLTVSQKINDNFTIYANVLNVFGIKAPYDAYAAYSLYQYNPAFAGPNIIGRFFRLGAKVDF